MSMFGAFGSGGGSPTGNLPNYTNQTPGGFGNQPAQQSPFGQYQQFMQGEAERDPNIPEGFIRDPQNPDMMIDRGRGGFYDVQTYLPAPQEGLSGTEQYQGAAMSDYMNLVGANQQNYDAKMGAFGDYRDSIMGGADAMRQSGQEGQARMDEMGQNLTQQGERLSELGASLYDETLARGDKAIESFDDMSAAQISSSNRGMTRQLQNEFSQMSAGAKMGDPAAIQGLEDLRQRQQESTNQTMTNIFTQNNQMKSNLMMQNAGLAGQAAGTRLGFEQGRMSYDQLATSVQQSGVQMAQAAEAQAANFEAQGLSRYADMIAANPFSPVAFLPTLSSFYQFWSTPGSGNFEGISDELLF